jgi:hypothetical protein
MIAALGGLIYRVVGGVIVSGTILAVLVGFGIALIHYPAATLSGAGLFWFVGAWIEDAARQRPKGGE